MDSLIKARKINLMNNIYSVTQQQPSQNRDSPRQTRAHRRNSGKCKIFTFFILKSAVESAP